jgi:phage gp46-like protein
MSDFALDVVDVEIDMSIVEDDLAPEDGLRTAILLSLFTDRRAEDDNILPADDGDQRGWWADEFADLEGDRHGSRLWLLDRSKRLEDVVPRAEEFARESLAWLLEDKVAERVEVVAEVSGQRLALLVTVYRPAADPVTFRFSHVWDGEAERAST